MSADFRWIRDALSTCVHKEGWALDLGGGGGALQALVRQNGWHYVNADLRPGKGSLAVKADAHALPFRDAVFALVILKDALEHFEEPERVMYEVRRVCGSSGLLVVWVPFLWPFHGDDYYRYTPLAIARLLRGFRIVRFESPLWVFSVVAQAAIALLSRLRLGFLERALEEVAWRLDRWCQPQRTAPRAFAAAYLVVAEREVRP
jgi:SAM-dependent methyltransferase